MIYKGLRHWTERKKEGAVMKKFRKLAVLAGLAGLMAMPAAAADVSYATVLSGSVVSVVSVAPVGATVKEGDVLLTVNSLAGPMPAARSDKEGVVKTVLVQPGSQVQQGAVVVVVETK